MRTLRWKDHEERERLSVIACSIPVEEWFFFLKVMDRTIGEYVEEAKKPK